MKRVTATSKVFDESMPTMVGVADYWKQSMHPMAESLPSIDQEADVHEKVVDQHENVVTREDLKSFVELLQLEVQVLVFEEWRKLEGVLKPNVEKVREEEDLMPLEDKEVVLENSEEREWVKETELKILY